MKSVQLAVCFGTLVAAGLATDGYKYAEPNAVVGYGYSPNPRAQDWLRERQDLLTQIPLALLAPVGLVRVKF